MMREETLLHLAVLLRERVRRGTRADTRALGYFKQAVLVIRWFLDGAKLGVGAAGGEDGRLPMSTSMGP
jgi:hypothetical protein